MRTLVLLAIVLMLVACGIDNTMYNAKNYFKSAQARALNANGRPTPQAVDEYTKAIQKCGIVLSRNSTGKRADDALFLMARALFYKRNAAFQAKDAFEGLIAGFPDSKHIPDAYIYLARVLREVNQSAQSEAVLERFVRDPKYLKHHARALLVLADFEIADKDYIRAQFWLERIIRDYRNADEFRDAYFLFGKNYYMQNEYAKSLEEFQTFINTRSIPRERKLEARYFVALNLYELKRYTDALREIRYVNRIETRPDMLSKARVLYGRALLSEGFEEDGLAELEAVTKTYPRTEHAAAAYYFWGRYLYYQKGRPDAAVTHLNRVRTEFSASVYAPLGQNLANAINQSKNTRTPDSTRNLQDFLDFHYLRAESFLGAIALPDSALTSYRRVISERDVFTTQADSLRARIQTHRTELDSLRLLIPVVPEEAAEAVVSPSPDHADTLQIITEMEEPEEVQPLPDSLVSAEIDDLTSGISTESDSLFSDNVLDPETPELAVVDQPSKEGIPTKPEDDPLALARDRIQVLTQNIAHLGEQLPRLDETINRFDKEIVPFCKYSVFTILRSIPGREADAEELYREMLQKYPRNMYTAAASAVMAGKTPNLVDPDLEEAESAFDLALDLYPQAPDSLVIAMQEFTESPFDILRTRANYRLGWFYAFEVPDTILAKPYLDAVLENAADIAYSDAVRRFYDGRKFLKREALQADPEVVDSIAIPVDAVSDSLLPELELMPDSLHIDADSLSLDDHEPKQSSPTPDPAEASQQDGGETHDSPIEQAPQDILPPREEDADTK